MKVEIDIRLPNFRGEIVQQYLKVLDPDTEYKAYTIGSDLSIVECVGIIENDGSYNYHNNFDDSEYVLCVKEIKNGTAVKTQSWFTLSRRDVQAVQKKYLLEWKELLEKELEATNNLLKFINSI